MLTQLGAALVGLFDTVMVGHYSTIDLAAVSFSNAIFWSVMVFSMGIQMAITPLVGIQVGRAQQFPDEAEEAHRRISTLFHNGLAVCLLVGIISLGLLALALPFLDRFGQDPVVIAAARPYYTLIILSLIPFLFFCVQKQFLEGLGNTTVAMVLTLLMNGLNILLNWILIYGKCGLEPMGATGAGVATLISRIGLPLCFFFVIKHKAAWNNYCRGLSLKRLTKVDIQQIFKIGVPIGGQSLLESIIFTLSFVIIGWINKETLAAHQIANQVANLTFMLALGIGSATTIRVSHQYGSNNLYGVKMASRASIHLVLLMNTLGATLMIAFRNVIPALFTDDLQVQEIATTLIVLAGLFQYADGLQVIGAAMLRGITDVKVPVIIALFAYIIIGMSTGLICAFPLKMGAAGIWIGFITGLSLAAILFHVRFHRKYKTLIQKA